MSEDESKVRWLAGHFMFGWSAAVNFWSPSSLPSWVPPEVMTAHRAGFDGGRLAMREAEAAARVWARARVDLAYAAEKR